MADVVVANPLRPDLVAIAAVRSGVAGARAAAAKEEKYAIRSPSDLFTPVVTELFGRFHHQFDGFLRQGSSGRTYPSRFNWSTSLSANKALPSADLNGFATGLDPSHPP